MTDVSTVLGNQNIPGVVFVTLALQAVGFASGGGGGFDPEPVGGTAVGVQIPPTFAVPAGQLHSPLGVLLDHPIQLQLFCMFEVPTNDPLLQR